MFVTRTGSARSPRWGAALLLVAAALFALLFGAAGALFGWLAQVFLVSIIVPLVLLTVNYRLALMLAVLLLPFAGSKVIPSVGMLSADNVLLAGAVVAFATHWVLRRLSGHKVQLPMSRELKLFYLVPLTLATVIGTLHLGEIPLQALLMRDTPSYGLKEYWVSTYLKQLLLITLGCICGAAVVEYGKGVRFMFAVVASGVVLATVVIGVVMLSGLSLSQASGARSVILRPIGLHPNDAGLMLFGTFATALFMREYTQSRLGRLALLAAALLMVVAILITFSRGAFVGLAVVVAVYVLTFRRVGVSIGVLTLALAGLAMAPDAIQDRLMTGISASDAEDAGAASATDRLTAGRVYVWNSLAPEILSHPLLGNGQKSIQWSEASKRGDFGFANTHSLYLGIVLDLGIVGTLCIVAFYTYLWRLFKRLSAEPRLLPVERGFFAGAFAGLVAWLVYGVTNGNWFPTHSQLYTWVGIGLAIGYAHRLAIGTNVLEAAGTAQPTAATAVAVRTASRQR